MHEHSIAFQVQNPNYKCIARAIILSIYIQNWNHNHTHRLISAANLAALLCCPIDAVISLMVDIFTDDECNKTKRFA